MKVIRMDARVAREFEIALPHELTAGQRLEATRQFAKGLANRYGTAVDFAIHAPHGETDVRNHHAHLMMTTRAVGVDGLCDKTFLERENKWLAARGQASSFVQLREIRQSWEQIANRQLAQAGHDLRIDHRSHQERGIEIEPTQHMGVHATQMQRQGLDVSRTRLDVEAAKRNAEVIRSNPEQVLSLITGEKSVFDRRDVARTLHRYIDEPQAFQNALEAVMGSKALVELQAERADRHGEVELARYSTREMAAIEGGMAESALRMPAGQGHGVEDHHVAAALDTQSQAIRRSVAADSLGKAARGEISEENRKQAIASAGLSREQLRAVQHIAGPEQIAAVVGLAGAGKSTMLAAARQAWEAQGFVVRGAALSGKAAEGLEETSGILSRTLASYEYGWQAGRSPLGPKDVLVIDEAGMVGSRQLARFVGEAERAGAKLVLVGDHEQLQAIGAGAPFRAIAERIGFAQLQDIRRQREGWQRSAGSDFARHRTAEGLSAYAARGAITFSETRDDARAAIVRDYMKDSATRPEGSRLAMAHRRVDVQALNLDIRAARQERGELASRKLASGELASGELASGEPANGEEFGERIFKTQNGPRAFAAGDRIVFLENNRNLGVKNGMLGTVLSVEEGRIVARLDGKDRNGEARIASVSIADYAAIDHGYATTIHKTQGATVDRAFVMASSTMDRHLTYVAMTRHRDEARLYAGRDEFGGMAGLSDVLSRDGSKETTLDYAKDYAGRRGMAEGFDAESEISAQGQAQNHEDEKAARATQSQAKKRSMFAGLKLNMDRMPAGLGDVRIAAPTASIETERERTLQATEAYARALLDAGRMRGLGLPVVEHQKIALAKSGAALDAARPKSTRELGLALRHDPETRAAMALNGADRAPRLLAGMERERQAQLDTSVRAVRVVAYWNGLEAQHAKLHGWEHTKAREKIEERMQAVIGAISRDAPVETVLRQNRKALGIRDDSPLERAIRAPEVVQKPKRNVELVQRRRGQSMER